MRPWFSMMCSGSEILCENTSTSRKWGDVDIQVRFKPQYQHLAELYCVELKRMFDVVYKRDDIYRNNSFPSGFGKWDLI